MDITERVQMSQEDKAKVVEKGVKQFARLEKGLAAGKEALLALEGMFYDAYGNSMITGTECMEAVAQCGVWRGKLAEIEAGVYPFHAEQTARAKAQEVDSGGPYAVLAKIAPPSTMDGGR